MSIEFKKVDRIIPPPPAGTMTDVFYNVASNFGGYVQNRDNTTWSGCREAPTGTSVQSSAGIHYAESEYDLGTSPPEYIIRRSFIDVDLSGLHADAIISSGTLRCHAWDYYTGINTYGAYVNLQQGTHGTGGGFTASDFDSFTGPSFGTTTFNTDYRPDYIELNQDALDYLNANIGSTVKFCIRENTHDYSNSAPVGDETFAYSRFYAYNPPAQDGLTHQEYKPLLTLKYNIPWEYQEPTTALDTFDVEMIGGPGSTNYNHDLRYARMQNDDSTWSVVRNEAAADYIGHGFSSSLSVSAQLNYKGSPYTLWRAYMTFDLGEMDNTQHKDITGARIVIESSGYGNVSKGGTPQMDVFQGNWDYLLTASGYDNFGANSVVTAPQTWVGSKSSVTFTLTSSGVNYLRNNIGGTVSFCFREYAHDVSDVAPPNPGDYWNMYINAGSGAVPYLDIDYTKVTEIS